jgi:hypothetical protein
MANLLKLSPRQYKALVKLAFVFWDCHHLPVETLNNKYNNIQSLQINQGWERFWYNSLYDICESQFDSKNLKAMMKG